MHYSIRPFRSDKYDAMAALGAAAFPGEPFDAGDLRHFDENQARRGMLHGHLVAEAGDRMVGAARYYQHPGRYHPQKFGVDIMVHPDFQRQGIGQALWAALCAELAPHHPIALKGQTTEALTHGVRFAEKLGFTERRRTWESILDVTGFDPSPWAGRESVPNITICSLAELGQDPDQLQKLVDMMNEVRNDVPAIDPPVPLPLEIFLREHVEGRYALPDGFFVALDGPDFVGLSELRRSSEEGTLGTGLTGVKRSHRGRGIALALKLHALAFARARGCRQIRTANDSMNKPMLSINLALGFVLQPAYIDFVKDLG